MIEIIEKKNCCGCSACLQKCPKSCISLKEDNEGFLYPIVDKDLCIDCGICEKVCPIIMHNKECIPLKVYAAKNNNEEIRRQSSSGGVFTLFAEKIILEGGVVFGAKFDENWEVKHDYTETIDGLVAFRGSKYIQSRIEDNYQKAEFFLKQGRKVLFSGTPCQIAGLKSFLRKEYENLFAIDFICHGVPSPGVWRKYLQETVAHMCEREYISNESKDNTRIERIVFRDKISGWKKYSFVLTLSTTTKTGVKKTISFCEHYYRNSFMKGFLADLYLRPSCYSCFSKSGRSGSDITLGDYWGIDDLLPKLDDDRGVSAIVINTMKGQQMLNGISVKLYTTAYEDLSRRNPAIVCSSQEPKERVMFFTSTISSFQEIISNLCRVSFVHRLKGYIKAILSKFFI